MSKYIIRNCPAIKEITTLLTSEPPQFQKEWRCCTTGSNLKNCKGITDCTLKRIVELCKGNIDRIYQIDGNVKVMQGNKLAVDILTQIEIEEVE